MSNTFPKAGPPWGSVSIYRGMDALGLASSRVEELYRDGTLLRARRAVNGAIYWLDEHDLAADVEDARRAHQMLNAQGVDWPGLTIRDSRTR
jgi:hypothetical protein